jgi:hypothetical protein
MCIIAGEDDVVALQEIRWKGKGSMKKSKFILHYSEMMSGRAFEEYASSSPRKLAGQYWNSHPFVIEFVLYEQKAHFITSRLLTCVQPQKVLRMKQLSFMKYYRLYATKYRNMMLS